MATTKLLANIGGKAYPFDCEEVSNPVEKTRLFKITDLTSSHTIYKESGVWKQTHDGVIIPTDNLLALGNALEKYYKL